MIKVYDFRSIQLLLRVPVSNAKHVKSDPDSSDGSVGLCFSSALQALLSVLGAPSLGRKMHCIVKPINSHQRCDSIEFIYLLLIRKSAQRKSIRKC